MKRIAFRGPFRPLIDNGLVVSYAGRGGGYRYAMDRAKVAMHAELDRVTIGALAFNPETLASLRISRFGDRPK